MSTNEPGTKWDRCLDEHVPRAEGGRHWPCLFVAEVPGWRPLTATLDTPPGAGPFPLVVRIHGGGWLTGHPRAVSDLRRGLNITETLLQEGYAVAEITYRLAGEGAFPMQIHDCASAVRYFRHHADRLGLIPDRFAAFGESAGGHMALLLGVDRPEALEGEVGVTGPSSKVQAVVDWYGVVDLMIPYMGKSLEERVQNPENPVGRLLGGPTADAAAARLASPVTHVGPGAAPCLIQHGTADTIVTFDHAERMRDALVAQGVPVDLHAIEGAEHGFIDGDLTPIMPRALDFLRRWL